MERAPLESPETQSGNVTRRQLLRLVVISVVGAGIVLGMRGMAAGGSRTQRVDSDVENAGVSSTVASTSPIAVSSPSASPETSAPDTVGAQPSSSQEIKVKAVYFQMPLVIGTKEDYFTLPVPAHYADLLAVVVEKHAAISPMMPSMLVLIDGVPAAPATLLRDGDEVDFIPAVAGG
jgi:hypothetical protein